MFSIDEVSIPVLSAAECSSVEVNMNSNKVPVDQRPVLSTNQLPMAVTVDGDVSEVSYINHTDHTDQSGHFVGYKTKRQLYSNAHGQNNQNNQNIEQQQPLKQLSQFRQSMVDAVYFDQRIRDSRASSFIISGNLPTSTVHSNKYILSEMCTNEFKVHVDIVSTKRLGKALLSSPPSSSTRIQPILVNVRNTEHTYQFICSSTETINISIRSW